MDATRESRVEAPPGDWQVRRLLDAGSAREGLAILREANAWATANGMRVWNDAELHEAEFERAAAAGELILGFEGPRAAATMLLQAADAVYWPEAEPGSALYVHKVAVRRAFAGRGWLPRLIDFAVQEARGRAIPFLRLDTIHRPKMQALYEQLGFRLLVEEPMTRYGRLIIRLERRL
jgi:GNAT superfamily N-acetyltransferase